MESATAQSKTDASNLALNQVYNDMPQSSPGWEKDYKFIKNKEGEKKKIKVTLADGSVIKVPQREEIVKPTGVQADIVAGQQELAKNFTNLANDQLTKISGILSQPLTFEGMPDVNKPTLQSSYGTINDQFALDDTIDPTGIGVQSELGDAGSIMSDYARPDTDLVGSVDDMTAGMTMGYDPKTGEIVRNYGPTDYSADRTKVEQAIMSRVDPYFERRMAAEEAKRAAQGLAPGTTAANEQQFETNRAYNDATMQAVLAGGQEQSRLAGLAQQAATFQNTATQQARANEMAAAQFTNSAAGQAFSQKLQTGTFQNAARAQEEAENLAHAGFFNGAQAQTFAQLLQRGQFHNAADAQQWMQNAAQTNLTNANQMAREASAGTAAAFGNQVAGQNYSYDVDAYNRAVNEMLQERQGPLNEIIALMGGGTGIAMPDFQDPFRMTNTSPDVMGMLNSNYQQGSANATANNNMWMQGITSLNPFG
jgi:hypothetical protein